MPDIDVARRLPLAGSLRAPLGWLIFFMGLPLAIAAVAMGFAHAKPGSPAPAKDLPMIVFFAPIVLSLVCVFLAHRMLRASVRVDAGVLDVDTGFGRKRLPLADLRNAGLRIVDLAERKELKPSRKLGGIGLPGFASGWFRLRNGEKALCLLLRRDRVCYLRSDDGTMLLLSLEHPQTLRALLAAH